jgi:hypothetical protein
MRKDKKTKAKPNAINRAIFRPSALPKLEECIHYCGDVDEDVESEFMARGQRLHSLCAAVLAGELEPKQIEDPEDRACVEWSLGEIEKRGIQIEYVEYDVPITIKGEEVTGGTIDCWGTKPTKVAQGAILEHEVWICDFKSGDERDYSAQFVAYSKPVMEETKKTSAVFMVIYYDLREVREFDIELDECEPRVERLAIRWLTRESEEPRINKYCGWCTVKGSCKLWLAEAEKALAILPGNHEPVADLGIIQAIKDDPVRLGEFYGATKRLAKLVEEWKLKDAVAGYLQSGVKVPGFTMSHRTGDARLVNVEMALIEVLPKIGSMKFAPCVGINATALKAAWDAFMGPDHPFPLEITYGETAYFPKAVVPAGTGKARQLRNARNKKGEK